MTEQASPVRRAGKQVAVIAAGYVLLLVISMAYWFPRVPRSTGGWLIFVLFAPPLYLLGEWTFSRFAAPWWESSLLGKVMKAMLLIAFAVVWLIAAALFSVLLGA